MPPRETKLPPPLPHRFDAVDTGEDQPVVSLQILQRIVERLKRLRLANLNERDLDDARAQTTKARGQTTSLVASATHKNSRAGQGMDFVRRAHEGRSQVSGNAKADRMQRQRTCVETRRGRVPLSPAGPPLFLTPET